MSSDHLSLESLGALVDGELSPANEAAAQAHLNQCHDCAKQAFGLHQLRSAIQRAALCNKPSPEVLARLTAGSRPAEVPRSRLAHLRAIALPLAAALILAAAALGGWTFLRHADTAATEALDQHLSTLSEAAQPEVLSSDRHTVKPWFEGKLPFSFNLPEPAALPPDTILHGADLAYVQAKPAALLLFTMRKHHVSVFVSQASGLTGLPHRQSSSGFQFVEAQHSGLEFLAVGDVSSGELDALVRSLTAVQ